MLTRFKAAKCSELLLSNVMVIIDFFTQIVS